jgi:Zn-dependent peptidase ImmA (M78 family)/DNA-binding XRE family transcriptional regulator
MLPPQSQVLGQEPMPEVRVNGSVLEWARSIRGLTREQAALLLDISTEELAQYELEEKRPLVSLLRLMAQRYQLNFASLLMPAPLPSPKRPTDHRIRFGKRALSIDTLVAIEEVYEALDAFADIASDSEKVVPTLRIGEARLDEDPETVAARERRRFGITVEQQQTWTNAGAARNGWRRRIEDLGVFTYMIPMPLIELSGFSIYQDNLAAICVNDRETTEGAKIFTLMHEYCHVLLRQTAISDENESDNVERFCNQFAASFLIPRAALVYEIGDIQTPYEFSDGQIKRLSTRFRVSNRAMALRLEKTGLAPTGFYERRTAVWDIPTENSHPGAARVGQPNAIQIRLKRIGRLHANTVIRAARRRIINSVDAHDLIGLRTPLYKIEAALG